MSYYYSICNVVVIDGKTGNVKFFQDLGYTMRHESAAELLMGNSFAAKFEGDSDQEIVGRSLCEVLYSDALLQAVRSVIDGTTPRINSTLFNINQIPYVIEITARKNNNGEICGTYITMMSMDEVSVITTQGSNFLREVNTETTRIDTEYEPLPYGAFKRFTGQSAKTMEIKYLAYKASTNKSNVIITGESGTGKSILAREIHDLADPNSPFVEVHCNAIAPTLFESELFGYVKGAFTGARSEGKMGYFEAANGGTIFLDEIGEIPLETQVKLLHFLQDKIIYKVGSYRPIKVDVRVIAATNRNLKEEVRAGQFRLDLYYRINVFPIDIPPLRERKSDLYLMINKILQKTCENYEMKTKMFSEDALQQMLSYNWPGNVRELENVIERAVILCESNMIYSEHLRMEINSVPIQLKDQLAVEEARIIEMTLIKYNGDKQKTIEELNISRSAFYDKVRKYNLLTD